MIFGVRIEHRWLVVCRDSQGYIKWLIQKTNLIPNEGRDKYLDATLKTGQAAPTWSLGLVDNASFTAYAIDDTAAKINTTANPPTTNGWQELVAYTQSIRPTWTPGAISNGSVDNSAALATFTMNATKTVRGAFLVSSAVKGGTAGALLGEVDFASSQAVISGDVIEITATATVA